MTDSSQATHAAEHTITHDVNLLVELVRLCRVMLLYGDPGAQRDHLLRSEMVPMLQAVRPGDQREVVILFDAWGGPLLPALHDRLRTALAQITTEPMPDRRNGQPFADVLRSWQGACNATFLIIFDRFKEYLTAPVGGDGVREFEDEFVQAANDATLRANFLLVLDQDAEPLLGRLRDRIRFLGNDSVRLPSAKLPAKQPVELSQADAASTADSGVERPAADTPQTGAAALETPVQQAELELSNRASPRLRRARPVSAIAIVVLICAIATIGIWFERREPQPVPTLARQRATPSDSVPEKAGERPTPKKTPAVGAQPRTTAQGKESPSAAAKAEARTKPKPAPPKSAVTAQRPGNANAGRTKENAKSAPPPPRVAAAPSAQPVKPNVPPAEPTQAAAAAAVQPPRTIDQVYEQRAGEECQRGLAGVICREKIRYQLCAGKWVRDEQPGMTRCYVW